MRFRYPMVAVALDTQWPIMFLERLLVFAAIKKAGVARVTETAALIHAGQPRRHAGMVPVTIIERRGSRISAFQQSATVDADAEF